MKKLIMIVVAVALAISTQAVQVKWGSGVFYSPASDGSIGASWSGSKWTYSQSMVTTKSSITAIIWESTSALSASAGDLYKAYSEGNTASLFTGASQYTGVNSVSAQAVTVNGGSSYASGDTVYAAVLYVLKDGENDAWYMENYATATIGKGATMQNYLANVKGGSASAPTSSATPMSWSPVPEPTSGLLMLLGFAGLALRRRRA